MDRMSDDVRRVRTEEQREQFHLARKQGGQCVACGKALGADENVYVERFRIGPMDGWTGYATAAVGAECASPAFLDATQAREPERCAGCGRGVYYRSSVPRRQRAICSRSCIRRAVVARRLLVQMEDSSGERG